MGLLRNIKEVFQAAIHHPPNKIYCPRCGSGKIRLFSSLNYWLMPQKYLCEDCGYTGPLIMELEKEE